jgi:hypothetical protein
LADLELVHVVVVEEPEPGMSDLGAIVVIDACGHRHSQSLGVHDRKMCGLTAGIILRQKSARLRLGQALGDFGGVVSQVRNGVAASLCVAEVQNLRE